MWRFIQQIFAKKYLIYQMVKRDVTSKYVDSYLGLLWAVLEPLATTTILAFVFTVGFRAGNIVDVPFFVFMFSGMVAFNYFSTAANEGIGVIRSYSYLVKKMNFQISILPIVKILSVSILHAIMVAILMVALLIYGIKPTWYWLQFIYYYAAMSFLLLGFSWFFSSISLFVPDVQKLVSIFISFLFYLTPVFWHSTQIPEEWLGYLKINPLYYVVTGYRDSFIYQKPFWINWQEGLYFWTTATVFVVAGIYVFKKLRPHFADVI